MVASVWRMNALIPRCFASFVVVLKSFQVAAVRTVVRRKPLVAHRGVKEP